MTRSGAGMAWDFFHPMIPRPLFIDYIEDRDLWQWKLPYSREFSAGLKMIPYEFEQYANLETDEKVKGVIHNGSVVLAYSNLCIKKICQAAAIRQLKGYEILAVNSRQWISEVGNRLAHNFRHFIRNYKKI